MQNDQTPMTKEEAEELMKKVFREHREKQKQKKPMYLQHMRCKQSERGGLYLLAFLFIFVCIPTCILNGLTLSNGIGLFILLFFGSMHFYAGFINKETVLAWTDD